MQIEVTKAHHRDAQRLAEVFNASFYSDFVRCGECPGYNKTETAMLAGMEKFLVFKILADGCIVGAISVRQEADNRYYLGALCVIPDYAGRGIGTQAMHFLDREFPQAVSWALETPADKLQNHYFYQKFGYRVTKEYADGSVPVCYFERWVQNV